MSQANRSADSLNPAETKITLGLLNALEEDGSITQRRLASELGIALGLVNAYLKRCVTKGLIKVQQIPSRRYTYYLTPKGFAEKSRLTASYLIYSFDFFRQARASCEDALDHAARLNWRRIALMGVSDLAEIAVVCAIDRRVKIVAVIDATTASSRLAGVPVVAEPAAISGGCDGVILSHITATQDAYDRAIAEFGKARVLVPGILQHAVSQLLQEEGAGS